MSDTNYDYVCNNCGGKCTIDNVGEYADYDCEGNVVVHNTCPHCGRDVEAI